MVGGLPSWAWAGQRGADAPQRLQSDGSHETHVEVISEAAQSDAADRQLMKFVSAAALALIGCLVGFDELCGKVGDGVNQAADLISATASIPSLNFIPLTTFGNWF